jgi:hypothetical protein
MNEVFFCSPRNAEAESFEASGIQTNFDLKCLYKLAASSRGGTKGWATAHPEFVEKYHF